MVLRHGANRGRLVETGDPRDRTSYPAVSPATPPAVPRFSHAALSPDRFDLRKPLADPPGDGERRGAPGGPERPGPAIGVALPTIAKELKAESTISWAGTSSLIAMTIFQVLYGRLSDLFGK